MNSKVALILVVFVASCGGKSNSNTPSATQLDPVAVTITESANGCLVSSNADAVIDYNYGVVSPGPRNLLWSCANFSGHTRVGIEAFYIYSGMLSCEVQRSIIFKAGDCSARASLPTNPLLAAKVEIVGTPLLAFIGGGTYEAIVDVKITNTGNLTLFGPTVEVESSPLVFSDLFPVGNAPLLGVTYLLPGQSVIHNGTPLLSTNVVSGQAFTFTAQVRAMANDFVVLHLNLTTSVQVIAP